MRPNALALLLMVLLHGCAPPALPDLPTPPLTPWGAIYGAARDERSVPDMLFDKAISTAIKAELLSRSGGLGMAVKVYCFRRRVTLLGRVDDDGQKTFVLATAWEAEGVRSVSAHWVDPARADTTLADIEIAARLRSALVADQALSATQIELEVFGGRVFLIGMVRGQVDVDRSVAHARAVRGVTAVTPLLVPSEGGEESDGVERPGR